MSISSIEIVKIHNKSFRANIYNIEPFRMIGLIDVDIQYDGETERVIDHQEQIMAK